MTRVSFNIPVVVLSVKVYRALLVAYPTAFQQEYGPQMIEVFRDCCLRAFKHGGRKGIAKLWATTLIDLIQSLVTEHSQKETHMKKVMRPEEIRRAGWALMSGAVSFVLSILITMAQDSDWSVFPMLLLIFVSLPLLVFGILGLRARYGEHVGGFGKNILLIGAILAPVTSLIGFFLTRDPFWVFAYAGPAILFVCLTLFGIVALSTRPLPRWNLLPVLAGFSYPAMILSYLGMALSTGDWTGNAGLSPSVIVILIIIQGIALLALGYILKSDVPGDAAVMA